MNTLAPQTIGKVFVTTPKFWNRKTFATILGETDGDTVTSEFGPHPEAGRAVA